MSYRTRILKERYHFRRRHRHFGVFLEPEVQEATVEPGKRIRLVYFVENDSEQAVTLRAELDALPFGWLGRLERADEGILAHEAWSLEPGERAHYALILLAPRVKGPDEEPSTSAKVEAILRVCDAQDPTRSASAVARVMLQRAGARDA